MTLNELNRELNEHSPENMIVQSFSQVSRELHVAFTCDGGPKEDAALWVTFKEAVMFHIPSVHNQGALNFSIASKERAKNLIPEDHFDDEEFGENGLKVFLLTNPAGQPTGFYIAAENVEAKWVALSDCLKVL